jgi:hypothetical protein
MKREKFEMRCRNVGMRILYFSTPVKKITDKDCGLCRTQANHQLRGLDLTPPILVNLHRGAPADVKPHSDMFVR